MSRLLRCHTVGVAVLFVVGLAQFAHAQIVDWTEIVYELDPAKVSPLPEGWQAGPFNLVINPGPGLAGNPAALAAFNRAADQWASAISDPITVTIDANMADLGDPSIIGQASSVVLQAGYDYIRTQWVADADADDDILASVPTAAQFSAFLPTGITLNGLLAGNKSALKAIGGFGNLDAQFGATDATITFNTQFSFDFDNSDGVTPGTMDFETVAAHETGHALGFTSRVDYIDWLVDEGLTDSIAPLLLDLFRFENDTANDPVTTAQFTTYPRSLTPSGDPITDFISTVGCEDAENRMATGSYTGDGRQASHWKDDGLTGIWMGIMDPTLPYGTVWTVIDADLRAVDMVGYDIILTPPEITGWRSMRYHSGPVDHELPIVLDASATGSALVSETRRNGIQKIEVDFDTDVSISYVPGQVVLACGGATVTGEALVNDGTRLEIDIAGSVDETCCLIDVGASVSCLVGDTDCAVRILAGDVNNDEFTNLVDMAQTKSTNGADPTLPGNARFDVNVDGNINLIDMALVKNLNGNSASCP